jgi:hypothetical protein
MWRMVRICLMVFEKETRVLRGIEFVLDATLLGSSIEWTFGISLLFIMLMAKLPQLVDVCCSLVYGRKREHIHIFLLYFQEAILA